MYVSELVAPGTVNTMPEATLDAVIDHGEITGDTVTAGYGPASKTLDDLEVLGISYTEVTDLLEREGVEKFVTSWSELRGRVADSLDSSRP